MILMSWDKALALEYNIAQIQAQQVLNGVGFDAAAAWDLLEELYDELEEVEASLREGMPKRVSLPYGDRPVAKPFRADGSCSKVVTGWMGEHLKDQIGGPFTRVLFEEINLNSDKQMKEFLLTQGWIPIEWNYKKEGKRVVKGEDGQPIKTSPKLTEDSYASIKGELGELIARRNVLMHRIRLLYSVDSKTGEHKGWINKIRDDGRISAEGIPQGTPTGRYRHSVVVNVPKAKESIPFGIQLRSLFIPKEGYKQVGADAVALENRIEGHYTAYYDRGEYARELLTGDPHTKNAEAFSHALGVGVDRDLAKSIKYAITYGAQPAKIAETAGCSLSAGEKLYRAFWKANPALEALKQDVEAAHKRRKYLLGVDGRKIFIRSKHALLNSLFQCTGSLVVKTATILTWKNYVPANNLDARIMLHQHDEWQAEVHPDHVEKYEELVLRSFVKAGEYFELNIPIEGDVKIGNNWAECH